MPLFIVLEVGGRRADGSLQEVKGSKKDKIFQEASTSELEAILICKLDLKKPVWMWVFLASSL